MNSEAEAIPDDQLDHDHAGAPSFLPHWLQDRWSLLTVTVAGVALVVGLLGGKFVGLPSSGALAFFILADLAGGYDVARVALPAFFRGKFDIDVLMLGAAAGAALLDEWTEGVFLLYLSALGQAGEHYAMERARHVVGVLGKLMPRTAFVKRGKRLEEVPVEQLVVDEFVIVKPGERVPVEGVFTGGESSIAQSAITGESVPVSRRTGNEVFAGTINQDNALDVRMSRLARDNRHARVIRLVTEAQEYKSPTQRFRETFARRFVPTVLAVSLITFVVWMLVGREPRLAHAIVNAVAALSIACPAALGLARPISTMIGVGRGAQLGVLVKNAEALERLEMVTTLVVDKTGTLSEGKPKRVDGSDAEDYLRLAASLEQNREHPLAAAIMLGAKDQSLTIDSKPAGILAIADPIKATTAEPIKERHELGLKLVMLTGDNRRTAAAVAKQLGLDSVKANVGIATGTGTDVALKSAGGTLVNGDLRGNMQVIRLSRATICNNRQNLVIAFLYNALGIPIVAGVISPFLGLLLSPIIAGAAMGLRSVSVICNALRLRNV